MRRLLALLALLTATVVVPSLACADGFSPDQRAEIVRIVRDALKQDPSILRDALVTLQADENRQHEQATLDAIGQHEDALLHGNDAIEGDPHGDVTMVEFYDPRCPYCRRMLPTFTELLKAEPRLKLVLKDLPILGPTSLLESRALLAAKRQGGYLKLRDRLMASNAATTDDSLRAMAEQLGLDAPRLLHDMDDPAIKAQLDGNIALAQQIGLQGTPAIIVGHHVIAGAAELDELRGVVDTARKEQRPY